MGQVTLWDFYISYTCHCIMTEFQPKRGGLSLALMDQGQAITLNVTPSSYPTTFWGLISRVATIAHTTEPN